MSFRGTSQSALDIIRDLRDEIDMLKRQVASSKQNTIRLGNWVLEAEADELVRMTNLITGAVSYVGANAETVVEGGGAYVEIPPFSFGGIIRNPFGSVLMRSNNYVMPVDFSVSKITSTLTTTNANGPQFTLVKNGNVVHTSPVLSNLTTEEAVSLSFSEGDVLYVEIIEDGNGFCAGLSVQLQL